ncbi:MAG: hypothetical protein N3J91_07340 [Verrucomicrobiae bacterium]|nr:hypothetical protein [Verrucomicrobiae bacterium]
MRTALAASVMGVVWLAADAGRVCAQTAADQAVVEEAVRRQEQAILMRKKLADAQAAQQRKDWNTAVKLYEDALDLCKRIGPTVDAENTQVVNGLVACRIELAKEAQKWGRYGDAEAQLTRAFTVAPRHPQLPKLMEENQRLLAEHRRTSPSKEITDKVLPEIEKLREQVDIMVQDGKLLYEVGRLDEAEARLREAARLDPENKAAFHYLRLVAEAKFARASRVREYDSANNFVEVENKWISPMARVNTLPVPNPYARDTRVHTSKGRQMIKEKLEKIRLEEVFYDGLRLEDVVKNLSDEAKKRDPDKKGVNFFLSENVDPPPPPSAAPAAIDPATGQPIAVPAEPQEPVNIRDIQIRINPALTDMKLIDVLEVLQKAAMPKIKYSIEDYAVVISLRVNEPETLYTRVFKVDANTFYQGLQGVMSMSFGVGGGGGGYGGYGGYGRGGYGGYGGRGGGYGGYGGYGGRGGYGGYGGYGGGYGGCGGGYGGGGESTYAAVDIAGGGGRGGGGAGQAGGGGGGIPWLTATNSTALGGTVRAFFEAHGLTMDPPKAFFFNDRTGLLMVRASLQDLDIVEQAIEVLNMAPQQLTIEARIAEFTQDDSRALGFDWWLGNVRMNSGKIDATTGTMPSLGPTPGQPVPGLPGGNGVFPGPGPAGTTLTGPGAQPPAATDNKLTGGLTPVGLPLATFTGILTDPQFRVVLRAIENRSGVDLLACPKITTLSGRQAQIKAVDIKYVVTDLGLDQTSGGGYYGGVGGVGGVGTGGGIGSIVQPITEPMEVGPTLDVVPSVSADGYTIQLTLIPTLKEFLGYDDPGAFVATIQSVGGAGAAAPIITPTPLPKFRLRQVVTSCVVWDGQTVVLGGLISEDVQKIKDKVPVLGDLPLFGRFFRNESSKTTKKNLAIFVTPTLIDPAGNRLHSDEEMPFAANNIPPQKPLVPVTPATPAPSGVPAVRP